MPTVLTLISTRLENLYQNLIASKNSLKISLSRVEDWAELRAKVQADGLYHQNRLAVAPNGSISYINDVSASIHPITQRIEERQEKKIGKIYYPAAGLSTETIPYYTSAYDMDMRKVIDVYAAQLST